MHSYPLGTPTWLRVSNDRGAFRLILEQGALSRSQLADAANVSKPTAGQMIARLQREGLINPVGQVSGARGPSAVSYGVNPSSMTGVAMSLFDSGLEAVAVDPVGTDYPIVRIPLRGDDTEPAELVRIAVQAACEGAGLDIAAVSTIAVGVQGAIDVDGDRIVLTQRLSRWPREGARALLERETGYDVILENDVNLAAIAERATLGEDQVSSFVLLWFGRGIGAGLDGAGGLYRGAFGAAGEIGYLFVPTQYSDGTAGVRTFGDFLGADGVADLVGTAHDSSVSDIAILLAGDPAAQEVFAGRITHLAATVTAMLDPEEIIIAGPLCAGSSDAIAARVQQSLDARLLSRTSEPLGAHVRVRGNSAGRSGVVLGARTTLIERIRDQLEASILPE